jgi:hypothetical protein
VTVGCAASHLVRGRIEGHEREHSVLSSLPAKHVPPQRLGVCGEDIVWSSRLEEPRGLPELAFELTRRPPRVTGEQPRPADALTFGQLFLATYHPHGAEQEPPLEEIGMFEFREQDGGLRLYRPTDEEAVLGLEQGRQRGGGVGRVKLRRTVEDDPKGAFLGVLDDEHDRVAKIGVEETSAGDQQLSL